MIYWLYTIAARECANTLCIVSRDVIEKRYSETMSRTFLLAVSKSKSDIQSTGTYITAIARFISPRELFPVDASFGMEKRVTYRATDIIFLFSLIDVGAEWGRKHINRVGNEIF